MFCVHVRFGHWASASACNGDIILCMSCYVQVAGVTGACGAGVTTGAAGATGAGVAMGAATSGCSGASGISLDYLRSRWT